MFLGEEKGMRVNVERATELAATGAAVVGTACPFCQTMFRDALGTLSQTPPKTPGHRADCGGIESNPRRGAGWYNPDWRAVRVSIRAGAAKPPEDIKRARSSIGRASDS